MAARRGKGAAKRALGCALFLAFVVGVAAFATGVLAEVNPGTDRPDVIRLFGVGCLAIGVGLAVPYVLSTARRDERRSSRPR
jgi:hypothetical protein